MLRIVLLLLLFGASSRALAQSVAVIDTIAGTVMAEDGRPIAGATVIITALPGRQSSTSQSSQNGSFSFELIRGGATGYLLFVRADGFLELRHSVSLDSLSRRSSITLQRTARAPLQAVQVRADRPRPPRSFGFDGDVGVKPLTSPLVSGVRGLLSPDDEGSLENLVSLLPGTFSNGLNAYGLGGEETLVTVNGVPTASSMSLPLGITATVGLSNMNVNGSLGGVAGAGVNISVPSGSTFHYSNLYANLDGRSSTIGPRRAALTIADNVSVGIAGNGPIGRGRWRYNAAASTLLRSADATQLLSASSAEVLNARGLQGDSVSRLFGVLRRESIDNDQSRSTGSLAVSSLVRLDRVATNNRLDLRSRQWSFIGRSNISLENPSNGPFSTWQSGNSTNRLQLQGIARVSEYIGSGNTWLHESQLSGFSTHSSTSANREGPIGHVRLASSLDDAQLLRTITFGGSGASVGETAETSAQVQTRLVRTWIDGKLASVSLDGAAGVSVTASNNGINRFGSLFFESIDKVASNEPYRITRTLNDYHSGTRSLNSSLAATAVSWPLVRTQLTSILRVDAEQYDSQGLNSANGTTIGKQHVLSSARLRNLSLNPRVNLTFYDNAKPSHENPKRASIPFSILHEGPNWQHGEYTNLWDFSIARFQSSLKSARAGAADFPDVSSMDCVGDRVPLLSLNPWRNPGALPDHCEGTPADLSASANLRGVSEKFAPVSTWAFSAARERRVPFISGSIRLAALYRLTEHLGTHVDENLNTTPRFYDADGRPIYVAETAINAATGATSLIASRLDGSMGRVLTLESRGRQKFVRLGADYTPPYALSRRLGATLRASYAWQHARYRSDGKNVLPSGNANDLSEIRVALPSHQLGLQMAKQLGSFALAANVFASSGTRFSPMIDADVNGDGWRNDVAITSTSAPSNEWIAALGKQLPPRTARCLHPPKGLSDVINTCEGPWSTMSNLSVVYLHALPIGGRTVTFSMNLANPLALADRLLHSERALKGWGSFARPDPILLNVVGFDETEHRFLYSVNPRFGQVPPSGGGEWAPYRITISAKVDIAAPIEVQRTRELLAVRRNGTREDAPVAVVERRLRDEFNVGNPYQSILNKLDTLGLSHDQYNLVRDGYQRFQTATDSLLHEAAVELISLKHASRGLVKRKQERFEVYQDRYTQELLLIGRTLHASQIELLSSSAQRELRNAMHK